MHSKSALLASLILACACHSGAQNYVTNHPPLVPQKYIELPLGSIKPQGWLLTQLQIMNQGDDWWPRMIMLKVLQQYFSATGDERVIPFMTRYFRFQYENLNDSTQLINRYIELTANSRCQENIMTAYWLYNQTKDPFLISLADKLRKQTYA